MKMKKLLFAILLAFILLPNLVLAAPAGTEATKSKFIPDCALEDKLPTGSACRDVSIFVYLGLNATKYLFSIIGALALLMFIYGGFTMILSRGAADKVKKGREIMVAAVIGLVVVFSAYALVRFLGESFLPKSSQYKI